MAGYGAAPGRRTGRVETVHVKSRAGAAWPCRHGAPSARRALADARAEQRQRPGMPGDRGTLAEHDDTRKPDVPRCHRRERAVLLLWCSVEEQVAERAHDQGVILARVAVEATQRGLRSRFEDDQRKIAQRREGQGKVLHAEVTHRDLGRGKQGAESQRQMAADIHGAAGGQARPQHDHDAFHCAPPFPMAPASRRRSDGAPFALTMMPPFASFQARYSGQVAHR